MMPKFMAHVVSFPPLLLPQNGFIIAISHCTKICDHYRIVKKIWNILKDFLVCREVVL